MVQNACQCSIQGHNCAATCSNTNGRFTCRCSVGYYVQRKTLCTGNRNNIDNNNNSNNNNSKTDTVITGSFVLCQL